MGWVVQSELAATSMIAKAVRTKNKNNYGDVCQLTVRVPLSFLDHFSVYMIAQSNLVV